MTKKNSEKQKPGEIVDNDPFGVNVPPAEKKTRKRKPLSPLVAEKAEELNEAKKLDKVIVCISDLSEWGLGQIEKTIADYGKKARDGKLSIEEMAGGTFTISNGGVYGSLMSTPILNPPQSGILGMHKTQMRPMVTADGKIEARPMMYLALSYDHRVVDGREAVSFLVRVKECIEDPQRILLDM